jgi:hypothetical protein
MREQLNFRQRDIQWGRTEGRVEGRTEGRTEVISVLKQMMQQEGQITKEKLESFLKRMEEEDQKKQPQSSTNINDQ